MVPASPVTHHQPFQHHCSIYRPHSHQHPITIIASTVTAILQVDLDQPVCLGLPPSPVQDTGYWLRFYVLLNTKQVILETFLKPISWLGMEEQNLTQQKHAFTNQNKCTTTQNKHKKPKARFSPSFNNWPENGDSLFLFWCFINLSLSYLLRHLPIYLQPAPDPHRAPVQEEKLWR